MAALPISEHYSLAFTQNVELLLQQDMPRFQGKASEATYRGESAQVVKQFGEVEFQDNDEADWKGDTVWSDIEHHQRWVLPDDYDLALPIAKEEEIRQLDSPQSSYATAMRAAWARRLDDTFITALGGTAQTGKHGAVGVTFPAAQEIAVDAKVGGSETGPVGLTIDKLLLASEMLSAAEVDESDARFIVCSAKQLTDLLTTTEVTSSDYNTVKALVQGEIDSFVGFTFVRSERLPVAATTRYTRDVFAWARSGMHAAQWNGLDTHIGPRPDKKYTNQVFMKGTIGATRTQEKKVVKIFCDEGAV